MWVFYILDFLQVYVSTSHNTYIKFISNKHKKKVCYRRMEEGLSDCTVDMSTALSKTTVSQAHRKKQSLPLVCVQMFRVYAKTSKHSVLFLPPTTGMTLTWNCSLQTPTQRLPIPHLQCCAHKKIWVWGLLCSSWLYSIRKRTYPSFSGNVSVFSSVSILSSFPVTPVRFPEPTCAEHCEHARL